MGTFLYYYRAVDCTILPSLNTISEQQAHPNQNNEAATTNLLNYAATNPAVVVQFKAIDMVIHIESDTSHLSKPRAHSRTEGK